jgi:hypothetical protein
MAWTKTANTCVSVFSALGDLKQFDALTTFVVAGPLTVQDLQFYNALATSGVTDASALALAKVLDNSLINTYAGTYKASFNSDKAVAALAAILQVNIKTIENLSDTADTIYTF